MRYNFNSLNATQSKIVPYFFLIFETNFRIFQLLCRKIFAFLFSAVCINPTNFKKYFSNQPLDIARVDAEITLGKQNCN